MVDGLTGVPHPKDVGERLSPVDVHFSLRDDTKRLDATVLKLRLEDVLSEGYVAELWLSAVIGLGSRFFVGQSVEISIHRGRLGVDRSVYGVVKSCAALDERTEPGMQGYRLRVVPAFDLLAHSRDTRSFVNGALPIVEGVLQARLAEGRVADFSALKRVYEARDFCVQYEESDRAFVRRLTQDEGIAYYYTHDGDTQAEILTFCDDESDFVPVDLVFGDSIPMITERPEEADRESFQSLVWESSEGSNGVYSTAFNWREWASDLERCLPDSPIRGRVHEDRRPHQSLSLVDASEWQERWSKCRRSSADQMERLTCALLRIDGRSNVVGMAAGHTFDIAEWPLDNALLGFEEASDARHVVLSVCHEFRRNGKSSEYSNTFTCQPLGAFPRPRLLEPKPRIHGPQTAVVVGPPNEEIHVDEHGRVQVLFFWDLGHSMDLGRSMDSGRSMADSASCWIRVAQRWSGSGFGSIFTPRIGTEVLVEFLDGDPDHPVITGCLYNGAHGTPYPLPQEKTKSGLVTRSTPDSTGRNEICFEDGKGSEELTIRAQRQYTESVGGGRFGSVGGNRAQSIAGDDSISVEGKQLLTVIGDRTISLEASLTRTVQQHRVERIGGTETLEVTGDTTLSHGAALMQTVHGEATLSCAKGRDVTVAKSEKITVGEDSSLSVAGARVSVAADRQEVTQGKVATLVQEKGSTLVWSETSTVLAAGGSPGPEAPAVVSMADGKVVIQAASEIVLRCGSAELILKSDGSIGVTGQSKVELSGGTGTISLAASGVDIGGPMVKSHADGVHVITGAMVKIN